MTTQRILYIHGANASPLSFNYIKSNFPPHNALDFAYNARDHLEDTITRAAATLGQPVHIVAHSLGGIIAVALSQRYPEKVLSVTTLATPFGGSEVATAASVLLPFNTFLRNIHVMNPTLREIIHTGPIVPTMNIITTAGGTEFELCANDGVVTIDSQYAFVGNQQIQIGVNHFEVLMTSEVVKLIEEFVWAND